MLVTVFFVMLIAMLFVMSMRAFSFLVERYAVQSFIFCVRHTNVTPIGNFRNAESRGFFAVVRVAQEGNGAFFMLVAMLFIMIITMFFIVIILVLFVHECTLGYLKVLELGVVVGGAEI